MRKYKKSYFKLFSAICDTIELIEKILSEDEIHDETAKLLTTQSEKLKAV